MRLTLQRGKGAYRTREEALGTTFGLSSVGGSVGGGEGAGDGDGGREGSSESEEGGSAVPEAEEVAEARAKEGLGSKKEFSRRREAGEGSVDGVEWVENQQNEGVVDQGRDIMRLACFASSRGFYRSSPHLSEL